jgi:ribonucleoside-diphosphate reductase alpha chain
VIRNEDTLGTLKEKVRIATIIGTYQALLTDFRYVRSIWKKNQEEERLLGVSLTGIMDHPVLSQVTDEASSWLITLKQHAIAVNKEWAEKLGINQAAAVTTVKPSGTVSQLVDSASGKHERYSQYYFRTVRADKKDPLAQLMRAQGFPVEDCVSKPESTDIFVFPVKAPEGSIFRNDRTAIQQLEHYLMFQTHWSEHNVSNTIYVKDSEWLAVGAWVYEHFNAIAGVSFLPFSDHSYQQAPYTECSKEEYENLTAAMPAFNWDALSMFEKEDKTTSARELACVSGSCDLL